ARERMDWVEQLALARKERKLDQLQGVEETKSLVDLRESEIPWYALLIYPDDWKAVTLRRKPFTAAATAESEEDRLVRQRMKQKIPKLNFSDIPLKDVVDFLRDVSGVSIFVKWNALEMGGIERSTMVNVHLTDVTIDKALRVILEDVGGVRVPLGYVVDESVITISTKDDLARQTQTHVYDIRDLIIRVPNFVSPRLDLAAALPGEDGDTTALWAEEGEDGAEGEEISRAELIKRIIELIMTVISPDSWRANRWVDAAGDIGSLNELSGQLVITQTAESHEAIMNLINRLREARALQIAIEARFITVSSGFLNSIGVDLDFYFNLGTSLGAGSRTITDPWTGSDITRSRS
ncbi:MAG: hypothetical protein KAU28_03340, partial [Phycisphaerae bacterium]|nr:hypothetical protein [Phycisphaerae bacterium]